MAQHQQPSMDGYNAAIDWLYDNRPHMMEYIAALGAPKNDLRCDRAMVVASPNMEPRLYANDEFLQKIGPAQAAGVLVHEFRHVLLDHFSETLNPKSHWKYPIVVRDAQEATINDSIELTGYELPDDVIRGENRGGQFYGYWSTDDAYGPMEEWYLSQQNPPSNDGDSEDQGDQGDQADSEDQTDSSSQQSGSGSGSGSGSSSGSESSNGEDTSDGQNASEDSAGSEGDAEEKSDGSQSGSSSTDASAAESESADGEKSDAEGSTEGPQGEPDGDQDGTGAAEELDEHSSSDGCRHGGYIEDENGELREMSEDELEEFVDNLNGALKDAIEQNPMPEDEKPTEGELDSMDQDVAEAVDPTRKGAYSKAGHAASAAEEVLAGGKLHLGWLKLLQRINPDVGKDDGGMNAKASYNWARPRRSTSLISGAHLPTPGAPRGEGVGTKQKPVALIALDFSGSIDRRLANAMKDMAQSIPEEHITARCFTFSTEAVPFDFRAKSNRVASGGTNFSCIELEAQRIENETGEYPYVICLTDGEAWFDSYGYINGSATRIEPRADRLADRWLWVDVETENDAQAFSSDSVTPGVQRQRNKTALPYDRSKL